MRVRFVTSTPSNIAQGSGTFVGISTLAHALRALGVEVEMVTPALRMWPYTLERVIFNRTLAGRLREACDATVGFDMDGYTLAGRGGVHVAAIKGVIADEARFEAGITRATMRVQAACEKKHVARADAVIATSEYSKERIREFYGASNTVHVVPELIDLAAWEKLFHSQEAGEVEGFVVLSVCRFYPRKRMHVLLAAAERLRETIPGLEIRIVGEGPEMARLQSFCRERRLGGSVTFLKTISREALAREYNRCHVFCLPSVQEGFGVVFLEAMAVGRPIVAARAGAAPEVVRHGLLVAPDNAAALAEGLERLYREPELRVRLGREGREFVQRFDAPVIAKTFLRELELQLRQKDRRPPGLSANKGAGPVR